MAEEDDEFWDYDKQVDMEAFSVETFYQNLSEQSRKVTGKIDQQKNEVSVKYYL